ncbi:MAG: hypothetical protein HKO53_16100 [Gemmatimonadetes bacterium]|nr:hypothetical protein [Gemmatimonadota bacterium]
MDKNDLERLFGQLRQEDRRGAPDFSEMLARARTPAGQAEQRRPTAPWWRAIPLGSALAAAGIGAIALMGGPDSSESKFRQAVRWADANPLFATVGVPSDALLEPPEWAMLKTGTPSTDLGAGLSRLLDLDGFINNERDNS